MAEERCGMLIKQINDALEKRANNQLREDNLTLTQVGMLMSLNSAEQGRLSMKELEKELHIAQPTVVGVVSRLEEKGFVKALGDPGDKRVKIVQITRAGVRRCDKANRVMKQTEEQLLKSFSEKERKAFVRFLQTVANNIQ